MRQLLNSFSDLVRIRTENHLVLQGFGCCVHKTADCQYHMALQWLPITGFCMIEDYLQRCLFVCISGKAYVYMYLPQDLII